MSTRSRIGLKREDGTIKSIYCHWDGYPEGVGLTLHKYYKDRKKIEQLLELGDISSLGKDYDEEISKADWHKFDEPDPVKREEMIKRASELTVAYKDRGDDSPARIDEDEEEFLSKLGLCWEEYTYLFKEDYDGMWRWHVVETPYFTNLYDELKKRDVEIEHTEQAMGDALMGQLMGKGYDSKNIKQN